MLWIKYYRAGKPYRESSHSTEPADAKKLLKLREGQIVANTFSGLKVEKIRYEELEHDLTNDYKVNNKRSLSRLERSLKHLKAFFEGVRAIDITTDRIRSYILQRQEEEAENATINRELSALKRMFNLARQMTPPKVINVPYISHLEENNVRQGYFEPGEYLALKKALPSRLRPVIAMAYHTGMRKQEILGLQWSQVDVEKGKVNLKPENTKNKEARVVYLPGEVIGLIKLQLALKEARYPNCPLVFFGEKGERIKDFRGSWETACIQAGLYDTLKDEQGNSIKNEKGEEIRFATKLFHDFRRTAVRNMVRAGVPERVAMMISGHKTRSVFERYNIVNEEDLERASKKVEHYHQERVIEQSGQSYGQSQSKEIQCPLQEGLAVN